MSEVQFDFFVLALLAIFIGLILYIVWLRIQLKKTMDVTGIIKKEGLRKEVMKRDHLSTMLTMRKESEKMTREKRDLIAKVEDLEQTIRELTEAHADLPPVVYFTDTASSNRRSFHAEKGCSAIERIPDRRICHAVACKKCVDKYD